MTRLLGLLLLFVVAAKLDKRFAAMMETQILGIFGHGALGGGQPKL